jgi:SAM-dependent methyltransferase
MLGSIEAGKTDRSGYNEFYAQPLTLSSVPNTITRFRSYYEHSQIERFSRGGPTKGYVRGLAVKRLLNDAADTGRHPSDVVILDAGCGQGFLTCYLAAHGFRVTSVDVSEVAIQRAHQLCAHVGVMENVTLLPESLEHLSVDSGSIDFVIGHASLHHFIKYEGTAAELHRVLKTNGRGYFADSFSENPMYRLFHNKVKMNELGDVMLNRRLIESFFADFEVELTPTDWFVMLDKLLLKGGPSAMVPVWRRLSHLWFHLDRLIPERASSALWLSGAVLTTIRKA